MCIDNHILFTIYLYHKFTTIMSCSSCPCDYENDGVHESSEKLPIVNYKDPCLVAPEDKK